MNEYQTARFAVGCSLAMAFLLVSLIIAEMKRKLARTHEELERVRRLASKSYSHRKCLEDAVFKYVQARGVGEWQKKFKLLEEQAKWSKEDND